MMKAAIAIVAVLLVAYLGMLISTLVRENGLPELGDDAVEPAVGRVELANNRWESARMRAALNSDEKLMRRHYGTFQPEPLDQFSKQSRFARAALAVGRLQLRFQRGTTNQRKIVVCSATLVSQDLVLTANHCLTTSEDRIAAGAGGAGAPYQLVEAAIRFGLLNDNDEGPARDTAAMPIEQWHPSGRLFDLSKDAVESSEEADYALFRFKDAATANLVAASGIRPVQLADTTLAERQDVFVLGHPLAKPLQVSRAGCRLTKPADAMLGGRFRHSCGTAPGVSGGPVLDEATCKLVGIHVEAPNRDMGISVGYGFSVETIRTRSALISGLITSPPQNAWNCTQ